MDNQKLELKSISEILGMNFFIPSYQRGYRWEDRQVQDLLNDILEYSKSKSEGFYCLQPIVIKQKANEDNIFKVIDGQQRLTTIFIIFKFI